MVCDGIKFMVGVAPFATYADYDVHDSFILGVEEVCSISKETPLKLQ